MTARINKALKIFKKNYDFFLAPLIDQDKFQQWMEESNQKTAISSFSEGIKKALNSQLVTGNWLFFNRAESGKKIDDISQSIENIEHSCAI